MSPTDRSALRGSKGSARGDLPSRREMLTLGIGAFLVASVPLARSRIGRTLVRRRIPAMGTVAEVSILHRDEGYAQRAVNAALDEIRWTEDLLSRFRAESDVGRANRGAPGRAVRVEDETGRVLESALELARSSAGRFDPCLGKAVALWDVGQRSSPPLAHSIASFAERGLYRALEVDRSAGTTAVRLHEPDVSIDLGGIGKGWGVDRAVRALRDWGIRDGLVNLGGDLYALGNSNDGDPWRVGVRDPNDPQRLAEEIPLSESALATSGDYEQFFTHDGRRYHHILDATTGEPARAGVRSITVAHDRCAVADACATAVFSVPLAHAPTVISQTAKSAVLVHSVENSKVETNHTPDVRTE